MVDFAANIDKFVASYDKPELRERAHDLCEKVVEYLSTSLYAETGGATHAPIRTQSAPIPSAPKPVSYADIVGMGKTPNNSGAQKLGAKAPPPSASGTTFIPGRGRTSPGPSTTKREDRRVLVTIQATALLDRPQPFAIRRALCASITGLTLASIPLVTPTRTGWAITPSDLATRDLLLAPENVEALIRILKATAVKQPQIWYNYAVPGVPATLRSLIDGRRPYRHGRHH